MEYATLAVSGYPKHWVIVYGSPAIIVSVTYLFFSYVTCVAKA
jgi:hypothetical protein